MNRLGSDPALGFSSWMYLFLRGSFFIYEFLLDCLNMTDIILSSGFLFT